MGAKNPLRPVYRDLDWGEPPPPGHTWIQRKFDGHWVSVDMGGTDCTVKSRGGRVLLVQKAASASSCTILGEMLVGTPESARSELYGKIIVFDLFDESETLSYRDRLAEAESICETSGFSRLFPGALWALPQDLKGAMETASRQGWEGLIFRNPDATYFDPIYRMIRRGQ